MQDYMFLLFVEDTIINSEAIQKNWNIGIVELPNTDEEFEYISENQTLHSKQLNRCILTYQDIGDKSIANCVEALLGAYLVSCGPQGAILFMQWMGFTYRVENMRAERGNKMKLESPYTYQSHECTSTLSGSFTRFLNPHQFFQPPTVINPHNNMFLNLYGARKYSKFEAIIDYRFKNRNYLVQAFTHESYSKARKLCYER